LEKGIKPKDIVHFTARDSGTIVKGFWKDTSAYQSLVPPRTIHARPMISGRMHHIGYLKDSSIFLSSSIIPSSSVMAAMASLSRIDYRSDVAQELDRMSLSAFDMGQPSAQRINTSQIQLQQPLQESLSLSGLEQVQKQLQKTELKQAQMQQQVMIHLPQTTTRMHPRISRARTTGKGKYIPFVFGPKLDLELGAVKEEGQGWGVFVKERHIVKGKKIKEGELQRMSIHPLNKRDAHNLGATLVDNSAARTFTIRPVKGTPKRLELKGVDPWSGFKFNKRGNLYIEKTDFAIDSQGELEEITAKGILARMKKLTPRKQKKPLSFRVMDKKLRKMSKGVYF